MKTCTVCNQTYNDDNLNFCLNDGGLLTEYRDDAPPTIQMNRGRTTQPNWSENEPSATWGSQPMQPRNQTFYPVANQMSVQGQNQTLPTVSLVLGILSIVLFCCYLGLPLGLAAMILGYLGYQNANNDPMQFGGRGMAIAGMIMGGVGLAVMILLIFLGVLGNLF
jgi:Domain of unknown function (DUF4190)